MCLFFISYVITHPPFGDITCPVVYSSSINQFAVLAMSIGFPIFPNGIWASISFISSLVQPDIMSVSIEPGAIELILMLDGPSSFASPFVNPSIPAFVIEYTTSHDAPTNPHIEEILIMHPDFSCIIYFTVSCVIAIAEYKFTSIIVFISSSFMSVNGPHIEIPALFINTSIF